MDITSFAPIAAILDGAYGIVTWLGSQLEPIFPVAASGAAIILITLLVRAALIPVGVSQAKAEVTRRRIAPRIAAIRQKWAKNPERMQRELLAAYAEEKTSPLAGILPLLIQMPIVSTIYGLFVLQNVNGHPNSLLTDTVFGIPLGSHFSSTLAQGALDPAAAIIYSGILLILVAVATATRRWLAPLPPLQPPTQEVPTAVLRMTRALSFLPYLTVVIAAFVPLAAALYLVVSTTWSFVERLVLRRRMAR